MVTIFIVHQATSDKWAKIIARFKTLKEAKQYTSEHEDTEIKKVETSHFKTSSNRQKAAVKWAEEILLFHGENAKFTGNISSYEDCNEYLNIWLELAKELDYYDRQVVLENPLDDDYYD